MTACNVRTVWTIQRAKTWVFGDMTRSLLINSIIKNVLEHLHLHQHCYDNLKSPFLFIQFRAGKFACQFWSRISVLMLARAGKLMPEHLRAVRCSVQDKTLLWNLAQNTTKWNSDGRNWRKLVHWWEILEWLGRMCIKLLCQAGLLSEKFGNAGQLVLAYVHIYWYLASNGLCLILKQCNYATIKLRYINMIIM